jgi:acyl-CoA thioesterase FadM
MSAERITPADWFPTDRYKSPPIEFGRTDQYNHLNNICFDHTFESHWLVYMATRGVGIPDLDREFGLKNMYKSRSTEFLGQIKMGDVVEVETKARIDGVRLVFDQAMFKDGKIVAKSTNVQAFVKDGKPQRVPAEVQERLRSVVQHDLPAVPMLPEMETGRLNRFVLLEKPTEQGEVAKV